MIHRCGCCGKFSKCTVCNGLADLKHEKGCEERIRYKLVALTRDERVVVEDIIDRLIHGKKTYGNLDVNDGRDWSKEAREELLDFLVYQACGRLKK